VEGASIRRALIIAAAGALILVAIAGALFFFAARNLDAIIAANRGKLLRYVGTTIGRQIAVERIKAHLGLGIAVELENLKIADDPAFSRRPFLTTNKVSCRVDFLPLLAGEARFARLVFAQPEIWLRRDARGELNISTFGIGAGSKPAGGADQVKAGQLSELRITSLSVEKGRLYFEQARQNGPIAMTQVDLDLDNFSARAPFDLGLKLALPASAKQNLELSGKAGPLLLDGAFDYGRVPIDLQLKADSIQWAPSAAALARADLPVAMPVSIEGSFSIASHITGSISELSFNATADLTGIRLARVRLLEKPAGAVMTISASGKRTDGMIAVSAGKLKLAAMEVAASRVTFDPAGPSASALVSSNEFDLAPIGAMFLPMSGFGAQGRASFRGTARIDHGAANADLTLTLDGVSANVAPISPPEIREVKGNVAIAGTRVSTQGLSFAAGSSRGTLNAELDSISPWQASYALTMDLVRPGEFIGGLDQSNILENISDVGSVHGDPAAPIIDGNLRSSSGTISGIQYTNLIADQSYDGKTVTARQLNMDALGGTVGISGTVSTGTRPRFDLALRPRNVDVQRLFQTEQLSAANWVRGAVSGQFRVAGSGTSFAQSEGTLAGGGTLALSQGKLIGVNIVAVALNKVAGAPGVSQLITDVFRSSNERLFGDPDTELDQAGMTFTMSGGRVTTHDLTIQSRDYGITADGWFDLKKRLNMTAEITLVRGLDVAIPVVVAGELPVPIVLPNIPRLAERIAMGALAVPGRIIRGGANGLGTLFGGSRSSGSSGSGSGSGGILSPLKNFLP